MTLRRRIPPICFVALLGLSLTASLPAQEKKPVEDGFTPLFNGKDLTGWVNVNCHPGTFFVKDGEIITTGNPTGFLRTDKQYENFVLEFDWMHVEKTKMANSGLFVWGDPLPAVGTGYTRGIEVQVLVNYKPADGWATSHGDIFSIWGAKCTPDRPHPKGLERCLPSEDRVKGGGEWNHYKVTGNNGTLKLEVNGKEVSGISKSNPRKGYLALESEGVECHFKNIKIKELPSTNPKPEECADVWGGHLTLFNGLDLTGWTTKDDSWKAQGGKLVAVGKAELKSTAKFARYELVFDWQLPPKGDPFVVQPSPGIRIGFQAGKGFESAGRFGNTWQAVGENAPLKEAIKPGALARTAIRFDGTMLTISVNGQQQYAFKALQAIPADSFVFLPVEGLQLMNLFVRELEEKK